MSHNIVSFLGNFKDTIEPMQWMVCSKKTLPKYLFGQSFRLSENESWVAECGKRSKVGGLSDDVNGYSAGCVLAMTWHRATDQYEQTFERRALNTRSDAPVFGCYRIQVTDKMRRIWWIWWIFLANWMLIDYCWFYYWAIRKWLDPPEVFLTVPWLMYEPDEHGPLTLTFNDEDWEGGNPTDTVVKWQNFSDPFEHFLSISPKFHCWAAH